MPKPNLDQVLSAVRWIIATGGGYAVGRGLVTTEQLTYIGGAAAALVPLFWSMFVHTDSAKIASVTALPEVKQVVVTQAASADSAAGAAAVDPLQPKVTK